MILSVAESNADESMNKKRIAGRYLCRVLQVVGLCGVLAFVISFASPVDDDVQPECMAGRIRQCAVRMVKITYPASAKGKTIPVASLPETFLSLTAYSRHPIKLDIGNFQYETLAPIIPDRSPPAVS